MTERTDILDQLSAYLDGELPASEARRVSDALEADASLRDELETLRKTRDLVRSLPRSSVGTAFTASVMASVNQTASAGRPGRWRVVSAVAAVLVAAVGITLICSYVLFQPGDTPAQKLAIHEEPTPTSNGPVDLRQPSVTDGDALAIRDRERGRFAKDAASGIHGEVEGYVSKRGVETLDASVDSINGGVDGTVVAGRTYSKDGWDTSRTNWRGGRSRGGTTYDSFNANSFEAKQLALNKLNELASSVRNEEIYTDDLSREQRRVEQLALTNGFAMAPLAVNRDLMSNVAAVNYQYVNDQLPASGQVQVASVQPDTVEILVVGPKEQVANFQKELRDQVVRTQNVSQAPEPLYRQALAMLDASQTRMVLTDMPAPSAAPRREISKGAAPADGPTWITGKAGNAAPTAPGSPAAPAEPMPTPEPVTTPQADHPTQNQQLAIRPVERSPITPERSPARRTSEPPAAIAVQPPVEGQAAGQTAAAAPAPAVPPGIPDFGAAEEKVAPTAESESAADEAGTAGESRLAKDSDGRYRSGMQKPAGKAAGEDLRAKRDGVELAEQAGNKTRLTDEEESTDKKLEFKAGLPRADKAPIAAIRQGGRPADAADDGKHGLPESVDEPSGRDVAGGLVIGTESRKDRADAQAGPQSRPASAPASRPVVEAVVITLQRRSPLPAEKAKLVERQVQNAQLFMRQQASPNSRMLLTDEIRPDATPPAQPAKSGQ